MIAHNTHFQTQNTQFLRKIRARAQDTTIHDYVNVDKFITFQTGMHHSAN